MRRRDFIFGSLTFLSGNNLFAKPNSFSSLSDTKKRRVLIDIVNALDGRYTFPIPDADEKIKKEALTVYKHPYTPEFGAWRPFGQKHKGIDIYGFGKDVVYFADGRVECVGRNINRFDHGNIVVVNHGYVGGYNLYTYYLHIGGINGIKKRDKVKMGDAFAMVDCIGISPDNKRLYNPGSKNCKRVAHLHFQIRVGDMYVNPNYFFQEYSKDSLPKLNRWRLAIKAGDIGEGIINFKRGENHGSF